MSFEFFVKMVAFKWQKLVNVLKGKAICILMKSYSVIKKRKKSSLFSQSLL